MARTAMHCAVATLCCVIAIAPLGCSKNDPSGVVSNIRPETHLSFAPDPGDTVGYLVQLNWFGWDPDGEVTHFLTQWDSLGWVETTVTDSVFAVSTDDSLGGVDQLYGYHTFQVKAVDNMGDEDLTPAGVSFTAENVFPETEITERPVQISWPYVRFEWRGSDSDGYVAGYGYRLSIREGIDQVEYLSEDDLPATQTVAEFGPLCGHFLFEVWSIDDQGAVDPSAADWQFFATCGGPDRFRITSNVFHSFYGIWSEYPYAYDQPPIEIFDGERLVFDWSAEGQGIKFRHVYDDTAAWSEWSPDDTHFEVTAEPGVHEMHVAVKDTTEYGYHMHMRFEAVETGLDDCILIVDDYDKWESNPNWGLDVERDAFYDSIVEPFGARYQWDVTEHLVHGSPSPPDVETLAGASTVIWYTDQAGTGIEDLLGELGSPYDALGGYVRAGGNLLLCGWKTLRQVAGESYPIDLSSSDETPGKVFIRDILRIGFVDNSGDDANPHAPWEYGYCLHGAVPTPEGEGLGFEHAYIDSGQCPDAPGKWFAFCQPVIPHNDRCGLNVEKVHPHEGGALEILKVDSFINPTWDGQPCATLYLSGTDKGNVCHLGFPPYYLQTAHAEALVRRVLTLFGEEER